MAALAAAAFPAGASTLLTFDDISGLVVGTQYPGVTFSPGWETWASGSPSYPPHSAPNVAFTHETANSIVWDTDLSWLKLWICCVAGHGTFEFSIYDSSDNYIAGYTTPGGEVNYQLVFDYPGIRKLVVTGTDEWSVYYTIDDLEYVETHCFACGTYDAGPFHPEGRARTVSDSFLASECRWYRFALDAGHQYRFTVCDLGGSYSADTVIELYNPLCELGADSDDYCGVGSQLDFTCPSSGPYFLKIQEYWGTNGLDYSLAYIDLTAAPPSGCDGFGRDDSTEVAGWTEQTGDWSIAGHQLVAASGGTTYVTYDGSNQADGCVQARAIYGSGSGLRLAGLAARYTDSTNRILFKVQDNAGSGHWDSWWVYDGLTSIEAEAELDLGTDALLRMSYLGNSIVVQIDTNYDGVWEVDLPFAVTTTASGLVGLASYNSASAIDDFCYGAECGSRNTVLLDEQCSGSVSHYPGALHRLGEFYFSLANSAEAAHWLAVPMTWDLVLVDEYANGLSDPVLGALIDHVSSGRPCVMDYWNLDSTLAAEFDATVSDSYDFPLPISRWHRTHPLFTSPRSVPDLVPDLDTCGLDGAVLQPQAGGYAVAGYEPYEGSGMGAIVVGNDGATVLLGEIPGNFTGDLDEDGLPDAGELVENAIAYVLGSPSSAPCSDCPPQAGLEGEPPCGDEYLDTFNSGCNNPAQAFSPIACGDVICGTSGHYVFNGLGYRDTDWYRIELPYAQDVTWAAIADFPLQLHIIDSGSGDCSDFTLLGSDTAGACEVGAVNLTLEAGVYWLWAGPSVFSGYDCCLPYLAIVDCVSLANAYDVLIPLWQQGYGEQTCFSFYNAPTSVNGLTIDLALYDETGALAEVAASEHLAPGELFLPDTGVGGWYTGGDHYGPAVAHLTYDAAPAAGDLFSAWAAIYANVAGAQPGFSVIVPDSPLTPGAKEGLTRSGSGIVSIPYWEKRGGAVTFYGLWNSSQSNHSAAVNLVFRDSSGVPVTSRYYELLPGDFAALETSAGFPGGDMWGNGTIEIDFGPAHDPADQVTLWSTVYGIFGGAQVGFPVALDMPPEPAAVRGAERDTFHLGCPFWQAGWDLQTRWCVTNPIVSLSTMMVRVDLFDASGLNLVATSPEIILAPAESTLFDSADPWYAGGWNLGVARVVVTTAGAPLANDVVTVWSSVYSDPQPGDAQTGFTVTVPDSPLRLWNAFDGGAAGTRHGSGTVTIPFWQHGLGVQTFFSLWNSPDSWGSATITVLLRDEAGNPLESESTVLAPGQVWMLDTQEGWYASGSRYGPGQIEIAFSGPYQPDNQVLLWEAVYGMFLGYQVGYPVDLR